MQTNIYHSHTNYRIADYPTPATAEELFNETKRRLPCLSVFTECPIEFDDIIFKHSIGALSNCIDFFSESWGPFVIELGCVSEPVMNTSRKSRIHTYP